MKTFPNPLTPAKERECLERLKEGDQEARRLLIEHNMRLVAHVVKKYQYTDYDTEDLLSVGNIGLIKAVNTFKPDRGSRLATYAAKCVENAILSQMRLWFQINPLRVKKNQNGAFWHKLPTDSPSQAVRKSDQDIEKAGVQTLRSLFTCFFYGCGFDNRIQ